MQYFFSGNALLMRSFMSSVSLIMPVAPRNQNLCEAVQTRRIVDQDFPSRRFVGCEGGEQVDQIAVVGGVAGGEIVRVRPVGAPDHSVGSGGNDDLGVRNTLAQRFGLQPP